MSSIASLTEQGHAQFKSEIFGRMMHLITEALLAEMLKDRKNEVVD